MFSNVLTMLAAVQVLASAAPLSSNVTNDIVSQVVPSPMASPSPVLAANEPSSTSSTTSSSTVILVSTLDNSASSPTMSSILPSLALSEIPSSSLGHEAAGANSSHPGNSSLILGGIHTANGTTSGLAAVGTISSTIPLVTTEISVSSGPASSAVIPAVGVPTTTTLTATEQLTSTTNLPPSSFAASEASPASSQSSLTPAPTSSTITATSANSVADSHTHTGSLGASQFWSLADVDLCDLPPKDKFPVLDWPRDSDNLPEQEPSIGLWHALRMDEWLTEVFMMCPAALDTRETLHNGAKRVAFSEVLGRLMFGMKDGADSAITCEQSRCSWNDGKGWSRGDMFPWNSRPCMGLPKCANQTNTNLEFIEQVRRWYTMQALGNVWDHKTAIASALSVAQPVISGRMEQFMNNWASTWVAAKWNPPQSPFSTIFNIFKDVANFIPVAGPAISSALESANLIFSDTDPAKVKSSDSDAKALKDPSTLQAVKDAVVTQGKGIYGAVTLAFEVSGQFKEALQGGSWTPEHWDPVFDIAGANMLARYSALFATIASGMSDVFDKSINGDPLGDNGFFTLVIGGLYSTSAMNPDKMEQDSLKNLVPLYVAYMEDKLLQAIMRSFGIFFIHSTYNSKEECDSGRQADIGDWAGSYCFQALDNTWRSLTPYASDFGETKVYHKDDKDSIYHPQQLLHQKWPHLTTENVRDKLRGLTTQGPYPADLSTIYQKLAQCFDSTNHHVFHRPAPYGSTTGFKNFPDAASAPSGLPLEALCHWNLPVIDRNPSGADAAASGACMDEYKADGREWNFHYHIAEGRPGSCPISGTGYNEKLMCQVQPVSIAKCKWGLGYFPAGTYSGRPGPALYYARALAYPANPDCVLNTENIACNPF